MGHRTPARANKSGAVAEESIHMGKQTQRAPHAAPENPTRARGFRIRMAIALAEAHPAGLMHGAVVMGAVLALAPHTSSTPLQVAGGATAVLVIYWLTHAYTNALGRGIAGDQRHLTRRLVHSARHEVAVILGGLPTILALSLTAGAGARLDTAVTAALWLTLAMLAGVGYLAAHLAGISGWRLVGETAFAALFGASMIVLNSLLH
jgi:hypothetical protein